MTGREFNEEELLGMVTDSFPSKTKRDDTDK